MKIKVFDNEIMHVYEDGSIYLQTNSEFHSQPERSKREDLFERNDEGRIKAICMRVKCYQPIWIREYRLNYYDEKKPLFCESCTYTMYSMRDNLSHIRGKNSFKELKEFEYEVIAFLLSHDQCKMRCSEHCGNTVSPK